MRWLLLGVFVAAPLLVATQSPLLAWRGPIYVASSFAAILGMGLMLVQPALVGGLLASLGPQKARGLHRVLGVALLVVVLAHVAGLWITSPPDVVDVLLFRSPAPFSIWGALALWMLILAGGAGVLRKRLGMPLWLFRRGHAALAALAVFCTVLHVLLIEGLLPFWLKAGMSLFLVAVLGVALWTLRLLKRRFRG